MNELMSNWSQTVDPMVATALALVTNYGLRVIAAIVILILGLWFAGWVSQAMRRKLSARRYADLTLVNFFASLVKYAIIAFTLIAVLEKFGVETTGLIAVLGAAGLAIGLALQGTLSNTAPASCCSFFRPFRVGDHIELASFSGRVKEITLFFTPLDTPESVHMIVPNGLIWGQWIRNHSIKDADTGVR